MILLDETSQNMLNIIKDVVSLAKRCDAIGNHELAICLAILATHSCNNSDMLEFITAISILSTRMDFKEIFIKHQETLVDSKEDALNLHNIVNLFNNYNIIRN